MSILRTATRFAVWGAAFGLALGLLYSVSGLVVDLLTIGLNQGTLLAFGALIGMPLIFGAAGFALGALVGGVTMAGRARGTRSQGDGSDEP